MRTTLLLLLTTACAPVDLGDGRAAIRSDLDAIRIADDAGGADLEIASDGTIWLTWVSDGALWLSRSSDGVGFAPPIPLGVEAVASLARRPRLAVDEERVAIALSDGIVDPARALLLVGDRDSLDLETIVLAETGEATGAGESDTLDQPVAAFAPDGELWASWKVAADHDYAVVVARETDGFAPAPALGFPGQPCECCPHELAFDAGDPLLLQRSNVANLREVHLGRYDGTDLEVSRVSDNGWVIAGCPFDGPRLVDADGTLAVTWMDATPGEPTVFLATSDDGGRAWAEGVPVLPEGREPQGFPAIAAAAGRFWVTVEELWARTRLLSSVDGAAWQEEPLPRALVGVDAASGGGRAGLAGVDAEGTLWFVPIVR